MDSGKLTKHLLDGALSYLFEEHTAVEYVETRPYHLRPSSFPYCPLRAFLSLQSQFSSSRSVPLRDSLMFRIGTTLHEVLQHYVAVLDIDNVESWCSWRCSKCRTLDSAFAPRPKHKCKKCGSILHPQEYEIAYGKYILGHIDNVLCFTHNGERVFVVIDWKSTQAKYLKEKAKSPDIGYVEQLGTYWRALEVAHPDKKFIGAALIYVDKSSPTNYSISVLNDRVPLETLRTYVKQFKKVIRIESMNDASALAADRICTASTEKETEDRFRYCKFRRQCTAASDEALTSRIALVHKAVSKHLPLEKE